MAQAREPLDRVAAQKLIEYELRMLRYASSAVLGRKRPGTDKEFRSALMDSALLHARSLYEFLTHKLKGRLVVATDFLKPGSHWKPSNLEFVRQCKTKINIFRSHISRDRIGNDWPWGELLSRIVTDIETALQEFVAELPPGERDKWHIQPGG